MQGEAKSISGPKKEILEKENSIKYQPKGAGGARSLPARTHRLQYPKWPPGDPKMAEGV